MKKDTKDKMNNLPLQNIFDSVCRCFGQIPGHGGHETAADFGIHETDSVIQTEAEETSGDSNKRGKNQPAVEASHSEVGKRRTNRLGLKDQQWDELFGEKNEKGAKRSATKKKQTIAGGSEDVVTDLGTAHAIAQAKLAANPPRYGGANPTRSKRKRSSKTREEIFRSKDAANKAAEKNRTQTTKGPTPFSKLIHPTLAMCFATPVRGTEEEADEMDLRSVDNSDANTLNTCEDTVTSTVYYDSKLAHMTETRPPMPLFNQFKIGPSKNEIRTIMERDSHSSVNMIHLPQRQVKTASDGQGRVSDISNHTQIILQPSPGSRPGNHVGSTIKEKRLPTSTSLSRGIVPGQGQAPVDEEMVDAVPGVKAVSDSSGSDESMPHQKQDMAEPGRRKTFLA